MNAILVCCEIGNRKKVVAKQSRGEGVYKMNFGRAERENALGNNRADDASVIFCEKGGAAE